MKEKKKEIEEFKCKQCGSSYTYTTSTTRVCRKCGYVEKLKEDKRIYGN